MRCLSEEIELKDASCRGYAVDWSKLYDADDSKFDGRNRIKTLHPIRLCRASFVNFHSVFNSYFKFHEHSERTVLYEVLLRLIVDRQMTDDR